MNNSVASKLSPSGVTPRGNKIHPTLEDAKAGYKKPEGISVIDIQNMQNKFPSNNILFYRKTNNK